MNCFAKHFDENKYLYQNCWPKNVAQLHTAVLKSMERYQCALCYSLNSLQCSQPSYSKIMSQALKIVRFD